MEYLLLFRLCFTYNAEELFTGRDSLQRKTDIGSAERKQVCLRDVVLKKLENEAGWEVGYRKDYRKT